MAVDFYRQDTSEYLFNLDDKQFAALSEIFEEFKYRTGFMIDQYSDFKLTWENQESMVKIIDGYIDKNDLNKNKKKTISVLEFRALMKFFSEKRITINLKGD